MIIYSFLYKRKKVVLKKFKTILNIDSKHLTLFRGKFGVNNSYVVNFLASKDYDGFSDGEFLNPEILEDEIKNVLVQSSIHNKNIVKDITIGVPSEFIYVLSKEVEKHFNFKTKISDEILQDVAESAIEESFEDKILISCKPIWVKLDDERKLFHFDNEKTSKITALFSYIYVDKSFVEKINGILSKLGVNTVN